MLRPDHIWFFFTVMLSLALAMSIPPRKPEPKSGQSVHPHGGDPAVKLLTRSVIDKSFFTLMQH